MSRQSLFSLSILVLMLASCGVQPTPMPTATPAMDAIKAGVQLIQQDMYLRLTEQAVNNQRIETGAKMTATQQVIDATATQQRYNQDVLSTQQAATATQQTFQVTVVAAQAFDTATAQAQVTATQLAIIGLTATVEAKGTEMADKKT